MPIVQIPGTPQILTTSPSVSIVGSYGMDADADILIRAMTTTPTGARQALINSTILSLKSFGIWTLLDEIWFLAAASSQAGLLGWKRYKDCTNTSMTFTTDRGFAGDGTTKYLSTGFNPSTNGVNFIQDNHSWGVYSRTNTQDAGTDMGCINTRLCQLLLRTASNLGTVQASITSGSLAPSVADSLGLNVARRSGPAAQQMYKAGASIGSNTSVSGALPNATFIVGGRDNAGTIEAFTARQYAAAFVGSGMTVQNQADLYTVIQAYMTSVGANV